LLDPKPSAGAASGAPTTVLSLHRISLSCLPWTVALDKQLKKNSSKTTPVGVALARPETYAGAASGAPTTALSLHRISLSCLLWTVALDKQLKKTNQKKLL